MRSTEVRRRFRTIAAGFVAAITSFAGTAAGVPAHASDASDDGFDNPWLDERRVANIAHGGGLHEAPENTRFAMATAPGRGADALELDLQITSDGHVVAMHDSTVDDTTDGQGCVVGHTLAEIQTLDAAYDHVPGEGTRHGRDPSEYPYRGVATGAVAPPDGFSAHAFTVPTLEEIFAVAGDRPLVVEIKPQEAETRDGVTHDCPGLLAAMPDDERPDIVAETARLIEEHGKTNQVMVASFIDSMMEDFVAIAPDVDTSFPLSEGLALYEAYQQGIPPENPHGHDAIQAPVQIGNITFDEDLIAFAHEHGIAVHFWTINDPDEMNMLLDWGADGIITDRVEVLAQVLADREETPPDPDPGWQSPFLCTTELQGLGQPIVDNQEARGTPVYPEDASGTPDRTADPLGWSEACQTEPIVEYRYRTVDGALRTLPPDAVELPADIAHLDVSEFVGADGMDIDGATEIPYLIRYERGTLPENRFLYSIAMLTPWDEVSSSAVDRGTFSHAHWNGRLLFSFGGGVAIGHSQGDLSSGDGTLDEAMRLGHAVLYTSGTRTSVHYNLALGGRTAIEAKDLFIAKHGQPRYTVGIGGSGGGIQQYVYAQNHPELLDAAIPQYSYPDMTTQTIHVGDCELLEHYMDVLDADNPRWSDWNNRKVLEGQNSIDGFTSSWQERLGAGGSTECVEGWRGSTPLAMNPTFGLASGLDDVLTTPEFLGEILGKLATGQPPYPDDFPDIGRMLRVSEDPEEWVEWTHWADAREVYGTDPATGMALVPWDNVGVQYGLRAVADGSLTPEEFLGVNASVGSWNEPEEALPESCGLIEAMVGSELATLAAGIGMCEGAELDAYSSRQMTFSSDPAQPAPRRSADVEAIRGAFEKGLVFNGALPREIPIIDARHYLEDELDMHNSHQSFAVRERIRRAQGDADNQLIWFLDARPDIDDDATSRLFTDGFRVMDEWMLNIERNSAGDVGASRPEGAVDRCWSADGTPIASGDGVWSGAVELIESGEGAWNSTAPDEVDGVPVGECSAAFPLHSTSRIIAGAPVTGDLYKCHTRPVTQAIADGAYGVWTPTAQDQAQLEAIFPNGVCDYSQPSVGNPAAPVYVGRFSAQSCTALARVATKLGMSSEEVVRMGVEGFGGVADAGGAFLIPVEDLPSNDGPCEITVPWASDEVSRARQIADAWGVDPDQMHHMGGKVVLILIFLAIVAERSAT